MLKSAGVYVIANIINAAIPFLLLPVLTRYLDPGEYGIVAMFLVLTSGLLPFMGFNLEAAIGRQYYDSDKLEFAKYVSNGLYLLVSSSLVLTFLLIVSDQLISKYSQFPVDWMWSLIVFSFFQKLTDVILTIWRVEKKPFSYGLFRILRTAFDLGLSIYLVIVLQRSWMGRIEGQLIAALFFGSLAIFLLFKNKNIKGGLNKIHLKGLLNFGLPLVPHVLGAIIITFSDRLFLTNMISLEVMGIYSVGYQIGMIIGLIQNSFNLAWQPWVYEKMKNNDEKDKRRMVGYTYLYFIGLIFLVIILVLVSPLILKIFIGEEFQGSGVFVLWIAMGFAFNGMYKMVVNFLFYLRKTILIGAITILTASLNIIFNIVLINMNGAVGAAQATALAFLIQFLVIWVVSARFYKLPWLTFLKF